MLGKPKVLSLVGLMFLALVAGACGDGEDRPGQVTSESGNGSATGTGSASGMGDHASGSASGTQEALAFEEADADTVVHVTLKDFEFEGLPASVKGPKVFFEAKNEGEHPHELEILDSSGDAVDEIEAFGPDHEAALAVELEPGTYTIQCLVEEDGKTHADLGMKSTLTVE